MSAWRRRRKLLLPQHYARAIEASMMGLFRSRWRGNKSEAYSTMRDVHLDRHNFRIRYAAACTLRRSCHAGNAIHLGTSRRVSWVHHYRYSTFRTCCCREHLGPTSKFPPAPLPSPGKLLFILPRTQEYRALEIPSRGIPIVLSP